MHITRTVPRIFHCNTSELRAYLDAGWRLASPEEYRIWARDVATPGQKRAPRAPALSTSQDEGASASVEPSGEKPARTRKVR